MTERRQGRDFLPAVLRQWCILGAALILAATSDAAAAGGDRITEMIGRPVSLVVQPETIHLSGPRAARQLVITGRYGDGSERDLTPFTDLSAEAGGVVTIPLRPGGFLQA